MHPIQKYLQPWGAALLASSGFNRLSHGLYSLPRKVQRRRPVLEVFLDPADPYSQLLAQVLPTLQQRFAIDIMLWQVAERLDDMFPEPQLWQAYAQRDAAALASLYGLKPPSVQDFPVISTTVAQGEARRRQLGHYQSAMIWFEGEWFWGLDRLYHLELRLLTTGCKQGEGPDVYFNRTHSSAYLAGPEAIDDPAEPLVFYFSMRSPYSYLALEQAIALTRHYQIPLDIRPLLPMMMRGKPVPHQKKMYIFRDTCREARRQGIAYGKVADPLGQGVINCYALFDYARQHNRGLEWLRAYARAVNVHGVQSDTDKGLRRIVADAELDWQEARSWLHTQDWQEWTEQHRQELYRLGLWGVPSFSYRGQSCWGQDRLWLVERWLIDQ